MIALASVVALLLPAAVEASTYYVSDCQTGAAAQCVAGSDSNAGTSPSAPWRTVSKVRTVIGNLLGADQILFARGASFIDAGMSVYNVNSTAASPIVFDAYVPAWGAGVAKPILKPTTGSDAFDFTDSGNADHDEGYTVRNLDLEGDQTSSGVFLYNDADYVTLDGLVVNNFSIGVYCGDSNPPNPGSDGFNDYFTLKNSTITNNGAQGFLGSCRNTLIEGNRFDNNGTIGTLVRNHNVYLDGAGSSVTVRGNVLSRSGVGSGICQGVDLVSHMTESALLIENNTIDESSGAGGGCYGIQLTPGNPGVAESFAGSIIRGNKIIDVGYVGIAVGACPGCVIENNVIVQQNPTTFFGIAMPAENIEVGLDAADTNLTVRNNSIYIAAGDSFSFGVKVETYGSTHKVVSNLVLYGAASSPQASCFGTSGLTLGSFTSFDYNLCYSPVGVVYSQAYANLAAAKAAGFDLHGLNADAQLAATPSSGNSYAMVLSAGSPAVNAGHPTLSAPIDYTGAARDSLPDIGATERITASTRNPAAPHNFGLR